MLKYCRYIVAVTTHEGIYRVYFIPITKQDVKHYQPDVPTGHATLTKLTPPQSIPSKMFQRNISPVEN